MTATLHPRPRSRTTSGRRRALAVCVLAAVLGAAPRAAAAQGLLPELTEGDVAFARSALAAMKADPRGPFLRIRWFCTDSTVHPPQGTPCRERGGGVQYAERAPAARQLDSLGFHTGTILQAVPFDTLFDARRDHHRLKELVVQQFLFEVDDAWIYRRARFYRGARQIEDEERRGQDYLVRLFADSGWTAANYLLALQLTAVVPHQALAGDAALQRIRNLATEIAGLDSTFMAVRIRIHSYPSRDDLDAVEQRIRAGRGGAEVQARLAELRDLLRRQYDPRHTIELLELYRRRLRAQVGGDLTALQDAYRAGQGDRALALIADLAPRLRGLASRGGDGVANLRLLELQLALQEQAFVLAQDRVRTDTLPRARRARVREIRTYVDLAYGAGWLSAREHAALHQRTGALAAADTVSAAAYREELRYVGRATDWAWGTAHAVFGPVEARYARVEPRAAGFIEALLRGSVLLPFAAVLERLGADAAAALGASHVLIDRETGVGLRGMNPGVAVYPLEIPEGTPAPETFRTDRIYVLPSATPELRPVGGVLTLDEGSPLSHIQLLARNLGIPNAVVGSEHLPLLRGHAGTEVLYAVSPMGRVVIRPAGAMTAAERELVPRQAAAAADRIQLDVSRLRLDRVTPIGLAELRSDASGVFVGPKAANLGQLAHYFPDRVSAGVALPFGMFYRHVNRPVDGATVPEMLAAAYDRAETMRHAGAPEREIDEMMFAALARVRRAILELPWDPEIRAAIEAAVREHFPDLRRGVFVRSDTNVEDLPQFSGAGLNLTVPHRVTMEGILDAVRRVWTSPFSERAFLWRKQLLETQGQIYPSVLLLESVHSDKSGVLVTGGLERDSASGLTVAVAEGVGGAVDGEQAETVVVGPDGGLELLAQAKAPVRRALLPGGGVVWVPARRPDTLLTAGDVAQLRAIVREWESRVPGAAAQEWDIEFGVVGSKVWLFQIRPFIRSRGGEILRRLDALDAAIRRNADRPIPLTEAI